MIDTGASINVIKKRNIESGVPIRDASMHISGITNGRITTLGLIEAKAMDSPIYFYIVPNNFPIAQEGILGAEFLRDASNMNFTESYVEWKGNKIPFTEKETIILPARSQSNLYVRLINSRVKVGYVPQIALGDGIFLGDAIATNRNGKAYIRAINTTEEDKEIIVPQVTLQEVEKIAEHGPCSLEPSADVRVVESANKRKRVNQVSSLLRLNHLNTDEMRHIGTLLEKHSDLFHLPDEELSYTNAIAHKINTRDELPIHVKQYRFPPVHKEEISRQIKDMLNQNIIAESESPYNSPLWIVPKKPDSQGNKRWRLVIDFRALNEKTLGDAYPLPNITDILDQLGSAKYFSIFDLASGFHQIPMSNEDSQKTAFSTPHGHYEYKRMPFGLKNAPATFQRLMDRVLSGLQGIELFVYLDDIVIYASSLSEHASKFNKLAERLRRAHLKLQPDKCEFLRKEVTYLGHVISETGVKPDKKKLEAVKEFPRPRTVKNIKQFLGLAGYYRRFINNFSQTAKPLTTLLKKGKSFEWGEPQEEAFIKLRDSLCEEPILIHPDFNEPFILTTDASNYAIGGILSQGEIGKDKPIAYASRLLNNAEQNYATIEKESLAIIYCMNHFRPYLYGKQFTIVTDHKPLQWLHSVKDPTSRLIRWRLKLAEYDYKVIYKAGKTNCNADALSRNPVTIPNKSMLPFTFYDSDSQDEELTKLLMSHKKKNKLQKNLDAEPNHQSESSDPPDPVNPLAPEKTIESQLNNELIAQPLNDDSTEQPLNIEIIEQQLNNEIMEQQSTNETTDERDERIPDNDDNNGKDNIPDDNDYESLNSEESETDYNTEDESTLFDVANTPYELARKSEVMFRISRENIINSKNNNMVVFINAQGEPLDKGAHALSQIKLLPKINDVTIARARPIQYKQNYIITLAIDDKTSGITENELIEESIYSLLDAVKELGLETLAICKGNVGSVPWARIREHLRNILSHSGTIITIYKNEVINPPPEQWAEIVKEHHASAIGGHKGVTKTYKRVRYRYFWPKIKAYIQQYVRSCKNCQVKKLVRRKVKQPMILTDTPNAAFDKISMDIMGPLPTSQSGKLYILTIQDLLTKHATAIPLTNAGAIDVADAFIDHYICLYGAPKALLTDQGTHFINSLMKAIAKRFKITHYKTTAYRPQANGSVERSHHVLWEYLKQTVDNKKDWDKHLKLACFSYNTSVHEGTKFTPYELIYAKTARTPSAHIFPEDTTNESYNSYLEKLYDQLRTSQENARENLVKAKNKSKAYYDKRINTYNFKIGDSVYLLKEPTHKLGDQYKGPYKIIEIRNNNNVKIKINNSLTRVVHTDKLKICPIERGTTNSQSSEEHADDYAGISP